MGIFHRLLTKSVILTPTGVPKAEWGDIWRQGKKIRRILTQTQVGLQIENKNN